MIREFYRPRNVEEALALRKQGGVFLAGGTQINRNTGGISAGLASGITGTEAEGGIYPGLPDPGPEMEAIYLEPLGLKGVEPAGPAGPTGTASLAGGFLIGALTTLQELADDSRLPRALRQAAGFIPSRSVRNMATLGGNIAAAQPDSYLIPVLLALDARLHTAGGRGIPVMTLEEYLARPGEELIIQAEIPPAAGVCLAVKESRSHVAPPYVSAGVRILLEGGKVTQARLALGCGCLGPMAARLREVESWLEGQPLPELEELESRIRRLISPPGDIWGSREYKIRVNAALTARAVLIAAAGEV